MELVAANPGSLILKNREVPIRFRDAADFLNVSTVTVWRWATGGAGEVFLESFRMKNRFFTSRQAVMRFVKACKDKGIDRMAVGSEKEAFKCLGCGTLISDSITDKETMRVISRGIPRRFAVTIMPRCQKCVTLMLRTRISEIFGIEPDQICDPVPWPSIGIRTD